MKLDARRLVDEVLVSAGQCVGAVFCTYTFDPAYFEDHVLRALLRLAGDPQEDASRYHEEARAALQATPVACLVDATVRRGGRRLPYDLILVRERTFHPKVILVLYETEARLAVGSGNTTKSGIEQNTELFFGRKLRYDVPADAAVLLEVDGFLEHCAGLADHPGSQLALIRTARDARLAPTRALAESDAVDVMFVDSFRAPLSEVLAGCLPPEASIARVGVLSPFYEQDDREAAHDTEGLSSVLGDLLALRPSLFPAALDIAVPWDDAPLAAPPTQRASSLDVAPGALWARRIRRPVEGSTAEQLEYLVIDRVGSQRVDARNSVDRPCRFERKALEQDLADGRLWPVRTPTVHAPRRILERIRSEYPVQLWLHPTASLSDSGRPTRRPLHAKLFLVTIAVRGKTSTYCLVGSANASRSALSRSVGSGGNVEAGVLFKVDGDVRLCDVLPSLVACPLDSVDFEEPPAIESAVDLSGWIRDVVHDAAARTLTLEWRPSWSSPLGPWDLSYLDRRLFEGTGPGTEPMTVSGFDLSHGSAEVEFRSGGRSWFLPIRVADLATLPVSSSLTHLDLRELLALLGRRLGSERLGNLRENRGTAGVATVLEAVFGEGFGPTDVFKAWWGLREDLSTAPTVPAFRHRLLGPTGADAVWQRLREECPERISDDEVWIYGCELLRELLKVELPDGPDRAAKSEMLAHFTQALRAELTELVRAENPTGERSWLDPVARFYGVGESDDGA